MCVRVAATDLECASHTGQDWSISLSCHIGLQHVSYVPHPGRCLSRPSFTAFSRAVASGLCSFAHTSCPFKSPCNPPWSQICLRTWHDMWLDSNSIPPITCHYKSDCKIRQNLMGTFSLNWIWFEDFSKSNAGRRTKFVPAKSLNSSEFSWEIPDLETFASNVKVNPEISWNGHNSFHRIFPSNFQDFTTPHISFEFSRFNYTSNSFLMKPLSKNDRKTRPFREILSYRKGRASGENRVE